MQKKTKKPRAIKKNVLDKQIRQKKEVEYLLILVVNLLLTIFFWFEGTGLLGYHIKELFLGLWGAPILFFPIAVLISMFFHFLWKKLHSFSSMMTSYVLLLTVISGLYHLSTGFEQSGFRTFYFSGSTGESGGILGGAIGWSLKSLIGNIGASITLIAILIILIIYITDTTIASMVSKVTELSKKHKLAKAKRLAVSSRAALNSPEYDPEEDEDELKRQFNELNKALGPKPVLKNQPEYKRHWLSNILNSFKDLYFRKQKNSEKYYLEDDLKIDKVYIHDETKNEIITEEEIVQDSVKETNVKTEKQSYIIESNVSLFDGIGGIYNYPLLDLLEPVKRGRNKEKDEEIRTRKADLDKLLADFGVVAKVVDHSEGPTVTRYEVRPGDGVKVSKVVNLADDIALKLKANGVRIEAPIPGKDVIGIELPNKNVSMVYLRELIGSKNFRDSSSKLSFALGKDIAGNCVIIDIAKMPHLLIAGATGSGKSVCINTLITSLLYKSNPKEVRLLMIDPKVVELGVYNGIPHLLIPVVTEPKKAAGALNWAVLEMTNRYKLFAENNVRDLKGYNSLLRSQNSEDLLPQIVIIIDELADLMMVAPNDVEDAICRLAQMARAAGMHLVIATQRPSVDVITGIIKANIPSRISFAVSSSIDSRTILDGGGAEKLLGKGDMLYSPVGIGKPIRLQGAFVSDKEVESVVKYVKGDLEVTYDEDIIDHIERQDNPQSEKEDSGERDELLDAAIEVVVETQQASASFLQRKLKVGYARAARIIDQMEAREIVTPHDGSKGRQVLVSKQDYQEMLMSGETQV